MGLFECSEGKPTQAYVTPGDWQPVRKQAGTRQLAVKQLFSAPFLPEGYPHSVTADFPGVVRWHLVQALSSYIRGILASHAVFLGLGVGNQAASALSAVFQFFVRDVVGLAGGILFASIAGGNFDANAKQWRLFADVLNNVALALDLGSPLVPGAFLLLASCGSIARAAVGMAGGATHTALTQHFATANNAAEVSAKADARERACNIVGSLIGMVLTHSLAHHVGAAWLVFLALTAVHIWANMAALRCLQLTSLNEARLLLLAEHYTAKGSVLTPAEASQQETLLIPPLRRALLALTGRQAVKVEWGASPARLPPHLQHALSQLLETGAKEPRGSLGMDVPPSSTGLHRRRTGQRQHQPLESPGMEGFMVVGGNSSSSQADEPGCRELAVLYVQGKVVQVVLQEGMPAAQQLRVYVSALLLALQAIRADWPAVQESPSSAAASPATRARTRQQQQQPASAGVEAGPQAPPDLEGGSQQLLAALQAAGWQLQGAYLPRPFRTFQW